MHGHMVPIQELVLVDMEYQDSQPKQRLGIWLLIAL